MQTRLVVFTKSQNMQLKYPMQFFGALAQTKTKKVEIYGTFL